MKCGCQKRGRRGLLRPTWFFDISTYICGFLSPFIPHYPLTPLCLLLKPFFFPLVLWCPVLVVGRQWAHVTGFHYSFLNELELGTNILDCRQLINDHSTEENDNLPPELINGSVSRWGVGPLKPLPPHDEMVIDPIWCRYSAGGHSYSEYMSTLIVLHLEDSVPHYLSPSYGSFLLSAPSFMMSH